MTGVQTCALPIFFAVSGVNFPVGVLIYWSTTNLWTWGQQFYVIKRNPTPGSPAWEELQKKKIAKGEVSDNSSDKSSENGGGSVATEEQKGQRKQPKKKKRKK